MAGFKKKTFRNKFNAYENFHDHFIKNRQSQSLISCWILIFQHDFCIYLIILPKYILLSFMSFLIDPLLLITLCQIKCWLHRDITFLLFSLLFRAAPRAYGSSQARGQIGIRAASLYHSHSNVGSEPCCSLHHSSGNARYLTYWVRPGIKSASSWILVRFVSAVVQQELWDIIFFYLVFLLYYRIKNNFLEFLSWLSGWWIRLGTMRFRVRSLARSVD